MDPRAPSSKARRLLLRPSASHRGPQVSAPEEMAAQWAPLNSLYIYIHFMYIYIYICIICMYFFIYLLIYLFLFIFVYLCLFMFYGYLFLTYGFIYLWMLLTALQKVDSFSWVQYGKSGLFPVSRKDKYIYICIYAYVYIYMYICIYGKEFVGLSAGGQPSMYVLFHVEYIVYTHIAFFESTIFGASLTTE